MATGDIKDPFNNYNFWVELDGITRASFQECSGFSSTVEVIDYREGGDNLTMRRLPGKTSYDNISLRWGMTGDNELYQWHLQAIRGNIIKKTGSIVLLDNRGEEVARWNFINAWPTVYTGPDLNATANEVAIESLELVHEGIERV